MAGLFILGSVAYPALELLYRRRTHPAMAAAGGLGLCALGLIHRGLKRRPLWQTALLGGACITVMEYALGRCLNRRFQIWDYRRTPLNWRGQVCLPFSLAWCALSAVVLGVMRRLEG